MTRAPPLGGLQETVILVRLRFLTLSEAGARSGRANCAAIAVIGPTGIVQRVFVDAQTRSFQPSKKEPLSGTAVSVSEVP
jgi:hypothetical protein